MTKVDVTMLRIAIKDGRAIECKLRSQLTALHVGPYNPDSRGQANAAARAALEELGFTIRDDASVFAIRLGGLRSESTTGLLGAMTNWLRGAEAKIGAVA